MKHKDDPRGLLQSLSRRDLIAMIGGAAVAWSTGVGAQQAGRTYRIGVLTSLPRRQRAFNTMFDELSHNGFIEGHNLIADPRGFSVPPSELEAVAAELVKSGQDVIVTSGPQAAHAAQHATQSIPIMAVMDDPLDAKLVVSMSHPGGNTTGLGIFATQLDAKRLEILHELVPTARRIGMLGDPGTVTSRPNVEASARELGLELLPRDVGNPNEIGAAIDSLQAAHIDALCILASPVLGNDGATDFIIDRMRRSNLPAMYQWPDAAVPSGALIAYGPREDAIGRLDAQQLVRLLNGAAPGELPIIQPTNFELWINLMTAKALNLTISPTMLVRADKVIE